MLQLESSSLWCTVKQGKVRKCCHNCNTKKIKCIHLTPKQDALLWAAVALKKSKAVNKKTQLVKRTQSNMPFSEKLSNEHAEEEDDFGPVVETLMVTCIAPAPVGEQVADVLLEAGKLIAETSSLILNSVCESVSCGVKGKSLQKFELADYEWTIAGQLWDVLKKYLLAIHTAIGLTKQTLNRIAMDEFVLHPQHKLSYFKNAGWEERWIATVETLVHDEFKQYLKSESIDEDTNVENNE
ncbi:hypothetical protein BDR05DRAFT_954039 [Suillus weaverae]|nr:hypothetical protein BDR05DRAFT_954039 [Suillus weaverae]